MSVDGVILLLEFVTLMIGPGAGNILLLVTMLITSGLAVVVATLGAIIPLTLEAVVILVLDTAKEIQGMVAASRGTPAEAPFTVMLGVVTRIMGAIGDELEGVAMRMMGAGEALAGFATRMMGAVEAELAGQLRAAEGSRDATFMPPDGELVVEGIRRLPPAETHHFNIIHKF